MAIDVSVASPADLPYLADVAARTFPLACPPSAAPADIAAFIDENLSELRFRDYLADPGRIVLCARDDTGIHGYLMLISGAPTDGDVGRVVTLRPTIELSKLYVVPERHGMGISAEMVSTALAHARELAAKSMWLGVNQQNTRAQRFYTKQGFTMSGVKTFRLGGHDEDDYVMLRPV